MQHSDGERLGVSRALETKDRDLDKDRQDGLHGSAIDGGKSESNTRSRRAIGYCTGPGTLYIVGAQRARVVLVPDKKISLHESERESSHAARRRRHFAD